MLRTDKRKKMCVSITAHTHKPTDVSKVMPAFQRTESMLGSVEVIRWHGECSFTQLLVFYKNDRKQYIKPLERCKKNSFVAYSKPKGHLLI